MTEDDWNQILRQNYRVPDVVGQDAADEKIRDQVLTGLPNDLKEALSERAGVDEELVAKALVAVGSAAVAGELDRFILDLDGDGHTLTELGQRLAVPEVGHEFVDPAQRRRLSAQIVELILVRLKDFVLSHPVRGQNGRFVSGDLIGALSGA